METTYTWADTGDRGTRTTLRNRGEPSGVSSVAAAVMGREMRRANGRERERLRVLVEGMRARGGPRRVAGPG